MDEFVKMLLIIAAKTPDGFAIVLPEGSIVGINWLYGVKEVRGPKGSKRLLSQVFGVVLKIGDAEVIIILHEQSTDDNGSGN